MKKEEFVKILDSTGISVCEGINKDINTNKFPRIVFWEVFWEFPQASSNAYTTVVTYQVSFFSKTPRNQKLLYLIQELLKQGINVNVSHEYIQNEKYFHSFFSLYLLESVIEKF